MPEIDKAVLIKLSRDDLNIIAKRLGVKGYRRGNKDQLVSIILRDYSQEQIEKVTSISFWDRYHNHIYGLASVLGLALGIIFYFFPFRSSENNNPPHENSDGVPTNASTSSLTSGHKRVAILEFNSGDPTDKLNWLGMTISSNITDQLRHFPEVEIYAAEALGNNLSDILSKKPDIKLLTGKCVSDGE